MLIPGINTLVNMFELLLSRFRTKYPIIDWQQSVNMIII